MKDGTRILYADGDTTEWRIPKDEQISGYIEQTKNEYKPIELKTALTPEQEKDLEKYGKKHNQESVDRYRARLEIIKDQVD